LCAKSPTLSSSLWTKFFSPPNKMDLLLPLCIENQAFYVPPKMQYFLIPQMQ